MNKFAHYNDALRQASLAVWVFALSVLLAGVGSAFIIPRSSTDADIAQAHGIQSGVEYPLALKSDHLKTKTDGVMVYLFGHSADDVTYAENFYTWLMIPINVCGESRCGIESTGDVKSVVMTAIIPRDKLAVHIANVEQAKVKFYFDDSLHRYGDDSMSKALGRSVMDITLTRAQAKSLKLTP